MKYLSEISASKLIVIYLFHSNNVSISYQKTRLVIFDLTLYFKAKDIVSCHDRISLLYVFLRNDCFYNGSEWLKEHSNGIPGMSSINKILTEHAVKVSLIMDRIDSTPEQRAGLKEIFFNPNRSSIFSAMKCLREYAKIHNANPKI